jgi:1,4-dihydroxy-2-naphthoate polyprenyltransferase
MLQQSTIQLLRFPFSFFLMPVYWFALSMVADINWLRALLIFVIIHLLLYPSSNGYNSYMDKDTDSIGGVKNPLQPTKQLFYITLLMDVFALLISLFISTWFTLAIVVYMVCSRLYSYRNIRLKRFAIIGYITVIVNQGAITFFMVYHGASEQLLTNAPWYALIAAACLIGGFYPITQVYQHKADLADNVHTLSMKLGIKGTFIWCAILYALAFAILFMHFNNQQQLMHFLVLQALFIPVLIYFFKWVIKVWKNENEANFTNTMKMNWLASTCANAAFILLLILQQIG